MEEANKIESEVLLFEQLGHRLALLEGDVEQNRKYILELINLFVQVRFASKTCKWKAQNITAP